MFGFVGQLVRQMSVLNGKYCTGLGGTLCLCVGMGGGGMEKMRR